MFETGEGAHVDMGEFSLLNTDIDEYHCTEGSNVLDCSLANTRIFICLKKKLFQYQILQLQTNDITHMMGLSACQGNLKGLCHKRPG